MLDKQRRTIAVLDALLPNGLVDLERNRIGNDFPGHVNDGNGSVQCIAHIFQHGTDPFAAHDRIEHLDINVLQFVIGMEQFPRILQKDAHFVLWHLDRVGNQLLGYKTGLTAKNQISRQFAIVQS